MKYIAILRGVNVSGKNMIKMPALVKAFEDIGFESVAAYLQSGNVLFSSENGNVADLQKRITEKIALDFGFDIPVIVFSSQYLRQVRKDNPFLKKADFDSTMLHVTFLAQAPDKTNLEKLDTAKYLPDEFVVDEKVIYLNCPGGYGTTKFNNNFFENKLKVTATTRNWNTVNKLAELSGE
ncbi:DUF1697 domain-containing protein [Dyadobacter psychrotolerans]|nr:DUF1697 domain-containing protein [Dyadobacter psychrotolerans]